MEIHLIYGGLMILVALLFFHLGRWRKFVNDDPLKHWKWPRSEK